MENIHTDVRNLPTAGGILSCRWRIFTWMHEISSRYGEYYPVDGKYPQRCRESPLCLGNIIIEVERILSTTGNILYIWGNVAVQMENVRIYTGNIST